MTALTTKDGKKMMSQETNSSSSEKSLQTLHVEGAASSGLLCATAKHLVIH